MVNRDLDFYVFARQACPVIGLPAGDVVFQTGESGETMYVILSGRVDIMMNANLVFESRGPRQAFGIMSMINKLPRMATARVAENAQLAVIDRTKYHFMLYELPSFALFLIHTLSRPPLVKRARCSRLLCPTGYHKLSAEGAHDPAAHDAAVDGKVVVNCDFSFFPYRE
jgi:CRP/FNR family transcriptional regulator, cyclic AMP receptor protein